MKIKSIILTKSSTGWAAHSPDAVVIIRGKTAKKALSDFKAAAKVYSKGFAQDPENITGYSFEEAMTELKNLGTLLQDGRECYAYKRHRAFVNFIEERAFWVDNNRLEKKTEAQLYQEQAKKAQGVKTQ